MRPRSSPLFAYTVRCTLTDPAVAADYERWLREEHLAHVLAVGPLSAELIRLDGAQIAYEIRYYFASRTAYEVYERDHAPRLRAEGVARFPLELGLAYERAVGEVVGWLLPAPR
jgi:hypothetical protein